MYCGFQFPFGGRSDGQFPYGIGKRPRGYLLQTDIIHHQTVLAFFRHGVDADAVSSGGRDLEFISVFLPVGSCGEYGGFAYYGVFRLLVGAESRAYGLLAGSVVVFDLHPQAVSAPLLKSYGWSEQPVVGGFACLDIGRSLGGIEYPCGAVIVGVVC